jgi:hypothetical protein
MITNVIPFLFPFLFLILWLGLAVYLILLATRLVNAVERIARSIDRGLPDSSRP